MPERKSDSPKAVLAAVCTESHLPLARCMVDFMDDSCAFLVDAREVAVRSPDGPYPPGSVWADPDLDQAAGFLRTIVERPKAARRRGAAARERVVGGDSAARWPWRFSCSPVSPAAVRSGRPDVILVSIRPALGQETVDLAPETLWELRALGYLN